MRKIIKIFLIILLLILTFLIYSLYFKNNQKNTEIKETQKERGDEIEQNNSIKNLKYEAKIENRFNYEIFSELSEIFYENTNEKIKMKNVIAEYKDNKENKIVVKSENAILDNNNFDTKFFGNVEVAFKKDIIYSDKLNIDFNNKLINIFSNVKYLGINGIINADNIEIDLTTREININMNDKKDSIEIFFK